MTVYLAFLRGVNLGKRQTKSADLVKAFEAMGFAGVKTLIASGNVRFEAKGSKGLQKNIEDALEQHFGFKIGVVLRTMDEIKAMIASKPFAKADPEADAAYHVLLFAEPMTTKPKIAPVEGDYEASRVDDDAIFFVAYKKPDGTYLSGGTLGDALKPIEKAHLVTMRNWNTIEKAAAK
jgi:uncharacterized protein (DUF1697 family)